MEQVQLEDIENLRNKFGQKRSAEIIKILGRQVGLMNALATEPGKQILSGALNRIGILLEKIINEDATEQERAEYRALRNIVSEWSGKINVYFKGVETVKGASNGNGRRTE